MRKLIFIIFVLLLFCISLGSSDDDCILDQKILVDLGYPPGGVSYIFWEFKEDFERLSIEIEIIRFDTPKNFFLQLYHSMIGNDGFYFGIQNRVEEGDQMLIFSRWGTRDLSNVEINIGEGGFYQSAGYEGDFVGVRLPGFKLKIGKYIFLLSKEREDDRGSWYKYIIIEKATNIWTWCGSIRFDKEAKISKEGSTWTELYGKPWLIQTYRYLPNWDIKIKSIKGNFDIPIRISWSYTDQRWGDHIPMEYIFLDLMDKSIRMQLGPDVVRK